MLLFILIGLAVWTLVVLCTVAICVQAGRSDRLTAAQPPVPCGGERRQRRAMRPAQQRLRPTA